MVVFDCFHYPSKWETLLAVRHNLVDLSRFLWDINKPQRLEMGTKGNSRNGTVNSVQAAH